MTKDCSICGVTQPVEDYYSRASACKPCVITRQKERNKFHKEKWTKTPPSLEGTKKCSKCKQVLSKSSFYISYTRASGFDPSCIKCRNSERLMSTYGLSREQFDQMLIAQKNRCAVCSDLFDENNKPFVDHDHETGQTRELTCLFCNTMLGFSKDSVRRLLGGARYLTKWAHQAEDLERI